MIQRQRDRGRYTAETKRQRDKETDGYLNKKVAERDRQTDRQTDKQTEG